jgi:hypothetical protein
MLDDSLHVDNIDVFCERGVFDIVQTRSILEKGKELGLTINFHGDELHPTGSAEVVFYWYFYNVVYVKIGNNALLLAFKMKTTTSAQRRYEVLIITIPEINYLFFIREHINVWFPVPFNITQLILANLIISICNAI